MSGPDEGATDRVLVASLLHPGRTSTVDGPKYRSVRDAMLRVLPDAAPGLTYDEMTRALLPHVSPELFPGGAKAGWWTKTVQLDLEAKGLIEREPVRPLRFHRTAKRT